ncbi:MAG: DUF432 domain-containing protein [Candidatus Cloacimonetes bacterium]|nr:DUF432 domain-containing protein [Candidatus Cloacimonadota bacterium]
MEKLLLSDHSEITINPVEPIFTPKEITSYLLIEFDRSFAIKPGISKKIYLTFPVEIGIFISKRRDFELLDVFSFARKKFSLYGEPNNGIVCKYWKSNLHLSKPDVNPLTEGVLELNVRNDSSSWINVSKALFKALGMKLYYNGSLVSMRATMKLTDEEIAETDFHDSPLEKGMHKSIELVTSKRLSVQSSKTIMMEGI